MNTKLKPYMIYSRFAGPSEGAFLCFAHTWREARNTGWPSAHYDLTDEFVDLTAQLLRKSDFLYKEADQEKLVQNIPHVIDSPTSCKRCEKWGYELDEKGICGCCDDE